MHLTARCVLGLQSRAFLLTNYTVSDELRVQGAKRNETWAFYPDDRPLRTLALFGDSRAALAPFLAHKYVQLNPIRSSAACSQHGVQDMATAALPNF